MADGTPRRRKGYVELEPSAERVMEAVAADGGYKVTTRMICRQLQSSRSYADKIFPDEAAHIYVNRRWAGLVGGWFQGGRLYSESSLDELVRRGAEAQARTVPVWAEEIAPAAADEILGARRELDGIYDRFPRTMRNLPDVFFDLVEEQKARLLAAVDGGVSEGWRAAWEAVRPALSGDGDGLPWPWPWSTASWVPCPSTWRGLGGWSTIAHIMDYGDSQEQWSRTIRYNSVVRLTLKLGGSERVMYGPALRAPEEALSAYLADVAFPQSGETTYSLRVGHLIVPAVLAPEEYCRRLVEDGEFLARESVENRRRRG